ncbi:MAG: SDR family NAD(P)-dependent oxidoreductase [Lachnospirales bacterium]
MDTVLVTGGAGFIGSNLCEKYIAKGYSVIAIDNLSSGNIQNLKNIIDHKNFTFIKMDIRDKKLFDVFNKYKPNIINHHAAQKSVPYSIEEPKYDLDVNLFGLLNLINLCKEFSIKKFLYVSSGGALSKEIVGNEKSKESDSPQLISPYAINKYAGEKYIEIYSKIYNFSFAILRYGNVYGERQIKDGESGVIPIFIDNIKNNKNSILRTYKDMPRGCTRDYVNVIDVVNANILLTENCCNDVFNIASSIEIPILDIYLKIKNIFNSNMDIMLESERPGDIRRSVLDIAKIENKLSWKPIVDLDTGLKILKNTID